MGDGGVNSAYGWGWGQGGNARALGDSMVDLLDEIGLPTDLLGDVRMNVKINVVDGLV